MDFGGWRKAPSAGSVWRRLARTGLDVLLFFFVFFVVSLVLGCQFPAFLVGSGREGSAGLSELVGMEVLQLSASLFSAWLVLRMRGLPFSVLGLCFRGYAKDVCRGVLCAVGLYAVGFGVCLCAGSIGVASLSFRLCPLFGSLVLFAFVALFEELTVRGFVLGRMLEAGMNRFAALFLSSLLFSLFHLGNPGFSFLPFLNILLAGIMLGASYIYTRNLCFPVALHWFWNWLQGPVLGFEVSGIWLDGSLLTLRLSADEWMNGGRFGFEGSLPCTLLLVAATALIIRFYSANCKTV